MAPRYARHISNVARCVFRIFRGANRYMPRCRWSLREHGKNLTLAVPLFRSNRGTRVSYDTLHDQWAKLCAAARLVDNVGGRKQPRSTRHQLRHTVGSTLIAHYPEQVSAASSGTVIRAPPGATWNSTTTGCVPRSLASGDDRDITESAKKSGYGTQQSMISLAGVFVVGVARDADNVADLLDAVVGVALERQGGLALLLIDTLGASAFATSGTRRRQTCIRSLADQVALKLGQRCEDVEDQPPA